MDGGCGKTGLIVGERLPDKCVAGQQLTGQIHSAWVGAQRPEDAGEWIESEPGLTLLSLELGETAAALLCKDPTKEVGLVLLLYLVNPPEGRPQFAADVDGLAQLIFCWVRRT